MARPTPNAKAAGGAVPAREGAVALRPAGGRRLRLELPRRGGERALTAVPGLVLAGALVLIWLLLEPRTPDLAAQVYRVGLFRTGGFMIWDEHWYAGHHLPGYSLLFPAVGSLIGVRAAGAACALVSTALFALRLEGRYGRGARWGVAAFAVAAAGDVWLGRLAFALGVSLGLAATLAQARRHSFAAAALAALCAAASPVAGLLLGLAAVTGALASRSVRPLLTLALPAAAVVLPLAALFPEGGVEPFPTLSFLATAGAVIAFIIATPREDELLRVAGPLYLLVCFACLLVPSPIGSNIERYGVLLAAPLLLAARPRPGAAGWLALAAIGTWVLWGPVRETAAVAGSPAADASYYAPLERFLDGVAGGPVRVEVPLTRSHWEAALLAPKVSIARGWEKQLDERYDGVLLRRRLTAAGYHRWLQRQAVAYVALPDVPLDPSSAEEGRLIRAGLPYLHPVFASRHWRVFAVQRAVPLLSGDARLLALGHDKFTLRARAAGPVEVRVHDTRYWTLTAGRGCVGGGPEGFTEVRAAAPGTITVAARFSLARALGSGPSCRR